MAVESTPEPNGLKTVWDTIVAPREAFESIRVAPTWGWALLIVIAIGTIASYLMTPAIVHALTADWPNMVAKNPSLAAQSSEQQQAGLAVATKIASLGWMFTVVTSLLAALLGTVILVIFNAVGRGSGTFGQYWAAQLNIAVVSTIGAVLLSIIVLARGVDSFTTTTQVQSAMPSLALLAPESAIKLHAFLSVFTPFTLWATGLEILALKVVGRLGNVPAWLGGLLTLLLPALVVAALAR